MDGPAWHAARRAIELAKTQQRLGGVFRGFAQRDELVLNGLARALHQLRARLTPKQRRLLEALLELDSQKQLAAQTGVSKQAVSKQARAAGVQAYREAEACWKVVLGAPYEVNDDG
jgi:hypothetical protein